MNLEAVNNENEHKIKETKNLNKKLQIQNNSLQVIFIRKSMKIGRN